MHLTEREPSAQELLDITIGNLRNRLADPDLSPETRRRFECLLRQTQEALNQLVDSFVLASSSAGPETPTTPTSGT